MTDDPLKDEAFLQQLRLTFLDELHSHIDSMGNGLMSLEEDLSADERGDLWKSIFRSAHTLKGAAAVVGIEPIQHVCHCLEDLFQVYRDTEKPLSQQVASSVLKVVDAMEEAGMRLRSEQTLDGAPLVRLIPELERMVDAVTGAPDDSTETAATQSHTDADQDLSDSSPDRSPSVPVTTSTSDSQPESTPDVALMAATSQDHATIRVPAPKLDALLAHSGELLVARHRLDYRADDLTSIRDLARELKSSWRTGTKLIRNVESSPSQVVADETHAAPSFFEQAGEQLTTLTTRLESLARGMEQDNRLLKQTCKRLDEEVMDVRMLPFSGACGGLQRAVRDIAAKSNKKIVWKLEGGDVEVDRSVLEGLKDPLLHLVRNAADHGIESPQQRRQAGKPESATITVSAALRGGLVEVLVQDDGSGLDLNRICEVARKRDIDIPDDPREQARLIFAPGFSTAKLITDVSGRGVGLDVVESQVESLHGSVDISFTPGKGTCFTLTVPLTLTTIRSMLVVASDQKFAIPTTAVDRLERFGVDQLHSCGGRESLLLGGAPIPITSLAGTLGLPSRGLKAGKSAKGLAIILSTGDQRVAVAVESVESEQEVLVKNLGSRVRRLRHFSGCTVLPNGRVALVLHCGNVIRTALGQRQNSTTGSRIRSHLVTRDAASSKRLLLVEDAITTRELLKNILEKEGYLVTSASDGQQAWDIMQEEEFDILVTDVDMPRMDGFDLTDRVRKHDTLRETPVVLVTARGTDTDKQRGVQVGANAYIVKGDFEQQNLLDTVAQLV